jgi:hypothetical protein
MRCGVLDSGMWKFVPSSLVTPPLLGLTERNRLLHLYGTPDPRASVSINHDEV